MRTAAWIAIAIIVGTMIAHHIHYKKTTFKAGGITYATPDYIFYNTSLTIDCVKTPERKKCL